MKLLGLFVHNSKQFLYFQNDMYLTVITTGL